LVRIWSGILQMASIQKRGSSYRVRITREGKRTLTATFKSYGEASKWSKYKEAEVLLGDPPDKPISNLRPFKEIVEYYRKTHSIHKRNHVSEIGILNILCQRWGNVPINQINKMAVLSLRDDLLNLGRSGSTINHYFNAISKLFQTLENEWGLQIENPMTGVKRIPQGKGRYKRIKDKVEKGLTEGCKAFSLSLLDATIQFAIQTGMRRSEITRLTWADIDLQSRSIFVQVSKNGESRQIPLTKEAQNILKNLPIDQSGKVFPITFTQLRSQFQKVKNYAKNKWDEPGINPYEDLRFHDLRHEALSRFSDAGLNIIELSCISGHKTLAMLQRYTHPAYEAIFSKLDKNEP